MFRGVDSVYSRSSVGTGIGAYHCVRVHVSIRIGEVEEIKYLL